MGAGEPYDPAARRATPLAGKLKERIRRSGPITVKEYMQACLLDPEHGYYRTRPAIGAAADFVTAPEISQVFGEIVGLWSAVVWQQMGSPARLDLVELGPGRGTMMADVLRAARLVPGFAAALRVRLVEPSETLRAVQRETLKGVAVEVAHLEPHEVPQGPAIVLANEIIDCLPVWQLLRVEGGGQDPAWHSRVVALDEAGELAFAAGPPARLMASAAARLPAAGAGAILEDRNCRGIIGRIAGIARDHPVAALFLDYGHTAHGCGDTLQAVRGHRAEHPLTSPGEADLTAEVDFEGFIGQVGDVGAQAEGAWLAVDGPVTQAEFLGRLGIVERASRLMAANPAKAGAIEAGVARLIAVPGMGDRFKVVGLRAPGLPPLPGL